MNKEEKYVNLAFRVKGVRDGAYMLLPHTAPILV